MHFFFFSDVQYIQYIRTLHCDTLQETSFSHFGHSKKQLLFNINIIKKNTVQCSFDLLVGELCGGIAAWANAK